MTEAEWLICTDPTLMLNYLRGTVSDRKLRLFAVACCRLFWHSLDIDASRTTIEAIERYADGQATDKELSQARSAAHNAAWSARFYSELEPRSSDDALRRLYFVVFMANTTQRLRLDEMPMLRTDPLLAQLSPSLLREIFGNPFRPLTLDPSWLTWHDALLVSMALRMYTNRDFSDMPILADALEEAGCDDADILGHCRQPGEHVRGCWVIDLLLGKS